MLHGQPPGEQRERMKSIVGHLILGIHFFLTYFTGQIPAMWPTWQWPLAPPRHPGGVNEVVEHLVISITHPGSSLDLTEENAVHAQQPSSTWDLS